MSRIGSACRGPCGGEQCVSSAALPRAIPGCVFRSLRADNLRATRLRRPHRGAGVVETVRRLLHKCGRQRQTWWCDKAVFLSVLYPEQAVCCLSASFSALEKLRSVKQIAIFCQSADDALLRITRARKLEACWCFFFLFTLPSPRKAGGANVDGPGFVRRVVVQGCVCVCVWREKAVVGGLRVRTVLVCVWLFSLRRMAVVFCVWLAIAPS